MAMRNPEGIRPTTLPNRKSSYADTMAEQADRQAAVQEQVTVWRAMLPELMEKFSHIKDPRRPGSIRHKLTVVLVFGLLMFVFQYGSRREANREMTRPAFWEVFRQIFPEIDSIPHTDTLERVLERIAPEELEKTLIHIVGRLLRKRKLQALLVERSYVVAIDGTQKFSRDYAFAPEALHRRIGPDTFSFSAYVLEAVLVGPQGVNLPLLAKFCENAPDATEQTKQDCESKAFHRLCRRLKKAFPKLRILLVADGLYPNGPVMEQCRALHFDFMIVLPEACLPSVWEEVRGLRRLEPTQVRHHKWGDREQTFWWVNEIVYDFVDARGSRRRMRVHVAGCTERWTESGEEQKAEWAWVSGRPLTEKNIVNRCNRAARHRWGIEEHFLTEKHQGYQCEHDFSQNWNALKCWHTLMRIGHLLNTLTLSMVGLEEQVKTQGIRGTIRFLRETWTGRWIDVDLLKTGCMKPPQLRLIL